MSIVATVMMCFLMITILIGIGEKDGAFIMPSWILEFTGVFLCLLFTLCAKETISKEDLTKGSVGSLLDNFAPYSMYKLFARDNYMMCCMCQGESKCRGWGG